MKRKPVPLAERLRELMNEHDLTQEALAEKVGMPFPTVRDFVYSRRTDPKLSQLLKFSGAFKMTLDEFVFGKR